MPKLLESAARDAGRAALVTIVEVKGSAPRHPGSKMLVRASGEIEGTVGGGKGEALAIEAAKAAIASRESSFLEVEMLGDQAEGKDLVCGGVNRMLVEFIADGAVYDQALASLREGRRVLLQKRLTRSGGRLGVAVSLRREGEVLPEAAAKALSSGKSYFQEAEGLFLDPLLPQEKLLIVGAGHVGLALARAATSLGFRVSVADDREELLVEERFGKEVRRILGPYTETIGGFPFDGATYAVILTRGHLFDLEASRAVLKRAFRYAGLIGSKRKVALLVEQLRSDGFPEEAVASLHAPIGLAIGAETPEEIAVSILAQMIAVRHGR